MTESADFLIRHGYLLLFGWVLAEQLGLPLVTFPVLMAAGALAGADRLDALLVLGAATVAALLGDALWYWLGKKRGRPVLRFFCRLTLSPDACVGRTTAMFARHGAAVLLVAKFVPGMSALATPLAGISGMCWRRFVIFDGLGTLAWVGVFVGVGLAFGSQVEAHVHLFNRALWVGLLGAPAGYVAWKLIRHRRAHARKHEPMEPEKAAAELSAAQTVTI